MPLGGSITQGVGPSDGNGYREMLMTLLTAIKYSVQMVGTRQTGTMLQNSHEGWRGFRLDEIDKKARKCVSDLQPNVFAVNAGSNDCLQDYQLDRIGQRMDSLLEFLWIKVPESIILLSTLVVSLDPEIDLRIEAVNESFRQLVHEKAAEQKRIVLADMNTSEGPSHEDLGKDGIHPGSEGYRKMAHVWLEDVDEAARKGFLDAS